MIISKKYFLLLFALVFHAYGMSANSTTLSAFSSTPGYGASLQSDSVLARIEWDFEELTDDDSTQYYIYNLGCGLFLDDNNSLGLDAKTLWVAHQNQVRSANGKFLSLVSQNTGSIFKPNWEFSASSSATTAATSVIEAKDSSYYVIGNKVNISTLIRQNRYITAEGEALGVSTSDTPSDEARWLFISTRQYAQKTASINMDSIARIRAIEALGIAIEHAEAVKAETDRLPGLNKLSLSTAISAAKTMKSTVERGGWAASLITTARIVETAAKLEETASTLEAISDYYVASLAEIANIEVISSETALRALTTTAKGALELAATQEAMQAAMNTMRVALLAYLQTIDAFTDGQDLTGLIANPSFETGTMNNWFGIVIDLDKLNPGDFTPDNPGSLAKLMQVKMAEGTTPVANRGANAMEGVTGKYYLNNNSGGIAAGQLIMQPLAGMPAGSYEVRADMATNPGILRLNAPHLSVLIVPHEVADQLVGDISNPDFDWSSIVGNFNLAEYLPLFLEQGKMLTAKAECSDINTFSSLSLAFDIEKGDIVLLALNAGTTPLAGTSAYRADNLQLTYVKAPETKEEEENKDPKEEGEEEEETDAVLPAKENNTSPGYNLQGNIVAPSAKGIHIKGGRKILRH